MIKGVIFDLDGTLIDSMHTWETVDKRFLKEHDIEPPPDISEIMKTLSMKEAAEYFIDIGVRMEADDITQRIEQIVYDEYARVIELKPGVTELLDLLDRKGIPYCVATANYRSLSEVILGRYGILGRFRFVLTSEECGIKKEDPRFFPAVAEKLGFEPHEICVADDALHCIKSSKTAGFITAAVFDETATDWAEISDKADVSVNNMSELAEYIDNNS